MQSLRAQGATEYLVLLAIVLIVALISVALLGFFPGMASDAQITQSQAYWQSASPIAIIETGAKYATDNGYTFPYLRVRNTGAYPIRITSLIGPDGGKASQVVCDVCATTSSGARNISDYFYLSPGEEKYFAVRWMHGTACNWAFYTYPGATGAGSWYVGGPSSTCQNSTASPGTLQFSSFGFEYIEYFDNNQQIAKRQTGKALAIKCSEPGVW